MFYYIGNTSAFHDHLRSPQ